MKNIDLVREALETYDFVGVRGLPQKDAAKRYRRNQFLAMSYTHYDDQAQRRLDGTSAVHVRHEMTDDKITEKIAEAMGYADTGVVILIAGDSFAMGIDHGEIIISNEHKGRDRGARFLAYLTL